MNNINKILILAPHTDDGEFGCGASIAKFIKEDKEVYYAAFSLAEESWYTTQILKSGAGKTNGFFRLNYLNRTFQ